MDHATPPPPDSDATKAKDDTAHADHEKPSATPESPQSATDTGEPPRPQGETGGLTPRRSPEESPRPKLVRYATPVRILLVVTVVFVSLFLLLRTLAVEPFGVPTGSMAPALSGHHRAEPCPRCGYPVRVGRPSAGNLNDHFARVACPNCDHHFSMADARDLSGDRLLVDKNVYGLRNPRRWEMVVFRCPDPDPKEFGKPYVKRLIGLPGETVAVIDGDVYVNGEIVRKGLAEVRETLLPVFDMNYPPPGGWGVRWVVAGDPDPRLPAATPGNRSAAEAPTIESNALVLDAAESPQAMAAVTYRHWHLDERKEEPVRVWNAYDGAPRHFGMLPAAHDFVLTCDVEVTSAAPGDEACFACRLLDGADAVTAEIGVGPKAAGRAQLTREGHGGLGSASGVSLKPGRAHRLEFALVDRRALLALDGKLVVPPADLPQVTARQEVRRPLQLGARGCRVAVRNLKLGRDIHYTQYGEHGTRRAVTLGPAEYYVLGDNSGNSQDSRKWPSPGVPEADFIGKPFLVHQPLRLSRVTVGGRERAFQTLDWSRLRWLH
jgi:signal peptidase I